MPEKFENAENKLTPELATQNPEAFKARLLVVLREKSYLSFRVWEKFRQMGWIDSLELDPQTNISQSRTDPGGITIGTIPWGDELRKATTFEDETFDYETSKTYILSHEISHKLAYLISQNKNERYNRFYQNAIDIRRDAHRGFSGLGSLDFYKKEGKDTQALEDLTELTNMYIWDPEYLKRFLDFLSDPKLEDVRRKLKLFTLRGETAKEYVYKTISEAIEEIFKNG